MIGLKRNALAARALGLREALRRPADPDSQTGREHMRHRAIALTALASALARAVSIATTLATVPLTLHFLGAERYGMWMALSAFSALLSFADFGIGNSVLTAVAQGEGRRDEAELRRQISSAFAAMSGVAAIMLAVLAAAYPLVDWAGLFNVSGARAVTEAGPAAAVFLAVLALTVPLGLVTRIQYGLQQGFRANLWQVLASLSALAALVIAIRAEASLPWLVLALAGTPLLVNLLNTADFFAFRRPGLRPDFARIDLAAMRRLSADGALFLILQVCAALLFQINALVIAWTLGAQSVASYAVPERLFSVVATVLAIMLVPLWPAYGDAVGRGDFAWMRQTLRRSLVLGVGGAAAMAAALVMAGPSVIAWWVGDAVTVPFALLAGLGLWKVIEAAGNAIAMFLNGINQLRIQVIAALSALAISLPLRFWWAEQFGLAGVIWATIAVYCGVALPLMLVAVRRALAGLGGVDASH